MFYLFIYLFIQHLLSALYTNKHVLMRYLINVYTVISIVDIILLIIEVYYISRCVRISSF